MFRNSSIIQLEKLPMQFKKQSEDQISLKKQIRSTWYKSIEDYKEVEKFQEYTLRRISEVAKNDQHIQGIIFKGSTAISYLCDKIQNVSEQTKEILGVYDKQGDIDCNVSFYDDKIDLDKAIGVVIDFVLKILSDEKLHYLTKKLTKKEHFIDPKNIFDASEEFLFTGFCADKKARYVCGDFKNGNSIYFGNKFQQILQDTFQIAAYKNINYESGEPFHLIRVFFMNNKQWNSEYLDFSFNLGHEKKLNEEMLLYKKIYIQSFSEIIADGLYQLAYQQMTEQKSVKIVLKVIIAMKLHDESKYQQLISKFMFSGFSGILSTLYIWQSEINVAYCQDLKQKLSKFNDTTIVQKIMRIREIQLN